MDKTFKHIPFTDRGYRIYKDGKVYSEYSQKVIEGKCISRTNKRLLLDACVEGRKESMLVHRLVYFVWVFNPEVLENKGTFKDFKNMPLIVHKNGKTQDNSVDNLEPKFSLSAVATWSNLKFPSKFEKFLETKRTTTIKEEYKDEILKKIKEGIPYPKIGKQYYYHPMIIYRFAKINGLIGIRPNGKPKLSEEDKMQIKNSKMLGIELAEKYNVSPTTISRVKKSNKT